jgi:bacterioferritin-associated ferredoxin
MYVCICRQVTCGQIRAAASEGVDSVRVLKEQLGVASECGKCAGCARGVLEEIHGCKTTRGIGQSS